MFKIDRPQHKLRLHNAIYRLQFYSNSLIHIVSLSNSHSNVAPTQKNRGVTSHLCVKRERPLIITYSLYSENIIPYHFYLKHVRKGE